jgi:hypothetical protein
VTDKEGKYRLDSIPADAGDLATFGLPVLAIPPDDLPYLVGFREVRRSSAIDGTTADFQLIRGVWAQGKVTNKVSGKPVRAYLQYQPAMDNPRREDLKDVADFSRFPGLPSRLYRARSDGTFRIAVLPGPGTITARGPDGEYLSAATATINPGTDGEPVPCQIALDPGRTLTGTILGPDDKPLTGVQVFNVSPRHNWTSEGLETNNFTLTAVDPHGRRSLVFLHPEKRLVKALEVTGDARGPLTVRLEPAGTVTGRLVDEDGLPRPRVDMLVHFTRKDTDSLAEHLPRRITTDGEGRFRVEGLAPGLSYQINLAGKPPNTTIGNVAVGLSVKSGETRDLGDVKGKLHQD